MGKGVTVRIIKDENGGVSRVEFDWIGFTGKSCDVAALKLYETLKSMGVEINEYHKEYKPEYNIITERVKGYEFEF